MHILTVAVAFVNVNVALGSDVATGTATCVATVDHARLANGARGAGVGGAGVVEVAQEAGLFRGALADIAGDPIVASSSVQAGLNSTVVDVDFAIVAFEAVDTNAGVASNGVVTSRSILTNVRPGGAFVNVLGAVAAFVFRRAIASIGSHPINAPASILAKVSAAVVQVDLAHGAGETCVQKWSFRMT